MTMKRLSIFSGLWFCMLICGLDSEGQQIAEKFQHWQQQGFQEKIYLHTDKFSYSVGETLWFRAYRVDAMFHSPKFYSGLIYVDLYNRCDSLIHRMMLVRTDSCFQGSLKLPATLTQGKYVLVAYSNWMQNFDPSFYFRKELFVYNPIELQVQASADFQDMKGKEVKGVLKFTDETGKSFAGALVNLKLYRGSKMVKAYPDHRIDKEGQIVLGFAREWKVTAIEAEFSEGGPLTYKHIFAVPSVSDDFDICFMPEGGHWLGNVQQRVAFKAIGTDGKGMHVTGTIQDTTGQIVTFLGTSHEGMGSFSLLAKPGEKYMATVKTADGKEKKVELPAVVEGVALQAIIRGEKFRCGVIASPGFVFPANLFLVIQCRGKVLATVPVKENMFSELSLSRLPAGIVHCFLVTATGKVYSERLVFVNKDDWPHMSVEGLQPKYAPRQLAELELQLGKADSLAELSVSVTDTRKTWRDSLENNILSYLMLCSDIKGNIENPSYYFDTRIPREVRNRNADLLMLTQAWKRFDVTAVCRGESPALSYDLELQQSVSGRIKNFWGKQAEGGSLALVASGIRLYRLIDADEKGEFLVENIAFPEHTTFVIQGFSKKKSKFVDVEIDNVRFRPLGYSLFSPEKGRKKATAEDDFFKSLKMNYYYDHGVKVYLLDEAVVKAERKEKEDPMDQLYKEVAANRITGERLIEEGYQNVWDWLTTVPGVVVDEAAGEISIRGGKTPALIVDDISMELRDIDRIPITEIKSIGVVKNVADMALLGSGGADGGIVIRLKDGASVYNLPKETAGFFRFTPMGHCVPDKFYEPKYKTAEERADPAVDERITVYWNPDVRTDREGKARISFYTADLNTTYSVITEGVTMTGKPVFHEFKMSVE